MSNLLNKIQEKPEHVRRNIAVTLTVISFGIIMGVWITFPDGARIQTVPSENNIANIIEASPFETVSELFNEAKERTTEIVEIINEGIDEEVSETQNTLLEPVYNLDVN